MKALILEQLREIEKTENVKILLAVESGSRAWGFASPDSDYDVRFIYIRRREDYLKLEGVRDVIEWCLDDTLDINGWDLKKALQLLHNSNPTVHEWCASPIVYFEREEFSVFRELLPKYFSEKKGLFHYWHTAESTYAAHLQGGEVKLKKYFYVLRPMLAAKWILNRKSAPPMLFEALLESEFWSPDFGEALSLDRKSELRAEIDRLLERKRLVGEAGLEPKVQLINDYIEKELPAMKAVAERMSERQLNWDELNEVFLRLVEGKGGCDACEKSI